MNIYRIKRFLPKIIILFIGLLIVFSLLLFRKSGFLTISKIELRTEFKFKNSKKIEQILKPYLGKSIFFSDTDKLVKEIKNQEIKIADIKIKKEFPEKLILTIKERQPLMVILKDNLYFFVDKEGVIFSPESGGKDLPFLEMDLQNPKIGSRIEIERTKIPQILAVLNQVKTNKITVKDDRIQLETDGQNMIILPMEASDTKIKALQMILNRFRIEGKRLTKIDLRFEKPVVSF